MVIGQTILLILTLVTFAVGMVLAPIYWFRAMRNMFQIWKNVRSEALAKYPWLMANRFNAMFFSGMLTDQGVKARSELISNTFKFFVLACAPIGLAYYAGYAT